MNRKIIIFVESPFNKRDYKRFGVEILQRNGFEVEIWDLTQVFHPMLDLAPREAFEFTGLRIFTKKSEVVNNILGLTSEDMIITWFDYSYFRFYWIYRAISKSKARYSVMQQGSSVTFYGITESLISKLKRVFWGNPLKLSARIVWDKLFSRIPYKWLAIKPAGFWFAGSDKSLTSFIFPHDKTTKIVFLHAFDYDVYLEKKDEKTAKLPGNAVFLDGYLPFHEDEEMLGLPHCVTAEKYYPSLCRFFDQIEKELNTKVDIAAHPRSFYEKHPDYFNKRTLCMGQTFESIRDAKLVISHSSTALNFAAIYYKPVIFIFTEEMGKKDLAKIFKVASWFEKEPVNIDKQFSVNWEKELMVDREKYDRFLDAFIKKRGTEEINSWQVISNTLRNTTG